MRILQTVFDMLDYGGIVNYTELLAKGLRAKGHHVDFVVLRHSPRPEYTRRLRTPTSGHYASVLGSDVEASRGWYGVRVIGYGSKEGRSLWRKLARKYDVILHQVPVPQADPAGDWQKVYYVDTPQILVGHDAHYPERYPHLLRLVEDQRASSIVAITGVNEASYNSYATLPIRRAFIGSPQPSGRCDTPWAARPPMVAAAHVWKKWKHMDVLVRSVPHLRTLGVETWIGGDGIEGRYMRAKEKCRPEYRGIWQKAERAGMVWHGMVSPSGIFAAYSDARVMADLSYSKAFLPYGNHVNRSVMEAYRAGAVPVVVAENMKERSAPMFSHGDTHLEIPSEMLAYPKDVADHLASATLLSPKKARTIIENGRTLVDKFWDYRVVTTWFERLIAQEWQKPIGIYRSVEIGTPTIAQRRKCEAHLSRIAERAR